MIKLLMRLWLCLNIYLLLYYNLRLTVNNNTIKPTDSLGSRQKVPTDFDHSIFTIFVPTDTSL
jgi:hypothetical protein